MKDYKQNFVSCHSIRLIGPTESHLCRISKNLINVIVSGIRNNVKLPLWNYTREEIWWFHNLNGKNTYSFIQLDITNYYVSISPLLLNKARNYVDISRLDIDILLRAKKTLLEKEGQY